MNEVLPQILEGEIMSSNWGVRPILFNIENFEIPSYSFFIALGLVIGLIVFYLESKKQKSSNENTFYIVLAAIIGGILGAKIPIWIINFKYIISNFSLEVLLSGRTIVGGILGGFIAVELTKKFLKIKEKKGNLFAPGIAIGIAIGRIGCFLRGCCFGKPTSLLWGVDFGDGILRHPTQLYESFFMICMFIYLQIKKKKNPYPGQLFKHLMVGYFTFRFFIEFLRVEPIIFFGLTMYQIISIIVIIYFLRNDFKSFITRKIFNKQ